jgi:hypothetical protein
MEPGEWGKHNVGILRLQRDGSPVAVLIGTRAASRLVPSRWQKSALRSAEGCWTTPRVAEQFTVPLRKRPTSLAYWDSKIRFRKYPISAAEHLGWGEALTASRTVRSSAEDASPSFRIRSA